jgi:hypothetical protein
MHTLIESILCSPWLWGGIVIGVLLLLWDEKRKTRLKPSSQHLRPIAVFVFIFSLSFFMGLLKIKFHAWRHTTPSSWALISLLLASFAAYRESSRCKQNRQPHT